MNPLKESTEIRISYGTENETSTVYPWVECMITCFYLYNEKFHFDSDETSRNDPFQLYILNYNEHLRYYDKDLLLDRYPDCAFRYLRLDGADIILDQCAGIQGPVPELHTRSREGFFNSLCFILALLFPQRSFQAMCCYRKNETDFVQVTQAEYDTIDIHFEQFNGEQGDSVTADWIIAPECISKEQSGK